MKERLLQFIWQMQYFNKDALCTDQDEPLQIVSPGQLNDNQGPDFLNAQIKIGNTTWAGSIEIHIHASDWKQHQHDADIHYQNVILHVVWQNDYDVNYQTGQSIPTLTLQHRVSNILLAHYEQLMNATSHIPCSALIHTVSALHWQSWKTRLVIERLERKTELVFRQLTENNHHWQTVFWWQLAANFGIPVNKACFEAIARSIPVTTLARHKNQIHQVECFLLGQAGLLNAKFEEKYPIMLQKEYRFFQKKYGWVPVHIPIKFHRIRPNNFPGIRLAQLAMLIHQSSHLLSKFIATDGLKEARLLLQVTANDYWNDHYVFDQPVAYNKKTVGDEMVNNVMINTVIPMLFAYGHLEAKPEQKTKAIRWLEELGTEVNKITKKWKTLGVTNNNAWHSQALTELTMQYCLEKNCLHCAIGAQILKFR